MIDTLLIKNLLVVVMVACGFIYGYKILVTGSSQPHNTIAKFLSLKTEVNFSNVPFKISQLAVGKNFYQAFELSVRHFFGTNNI